ALLVLCEGGRRGPGRRGRCLRTRRVHQNRGCFMPDGQNMRPVIRLTATVAAAMLVAGVACTEKRRTGARVDVAPTVSPLSDVRVVAARDGVEVGRTATSW